VFQPPPTINLSAGFFLSNSRFSLDRSELKIIIVFIFIIGNGLGSVFGISLVSVGATLLGVALFEFLLA